MTITTAGDLPALATRPQVAEFTQISTQTLARWAGEGKGPRFLKIGGPNGAVRYKREAVLAWLDSLDEAS